MAQRRSLLPRLLRAPVFLPVPRTDSRKLVQSAASANEGDTEAWEHYSYIMILYTPVSQQTNACAQRQAAATNGRVAMYDIHGAAQQCMALAVLAV